MSEGRQHSNPWAEKLSQISLPDGGESWKAMEALLDREMPIGGRRDWRRWFLLVLLLLLLIGVCNCPGRRWLFSGKTVTFGTVPAGDKLGRGPSAGGPATVARNGGTTQVGDSVVEVRAGVKKDRVSGRGKGNPGTRERVVSAGKTGTTREPGRTRESGRTREPGTKRERGTTKAEGTINPTNIGRTGTTDTMVRVTPDTAAKKTTAKNPVQNPAKNPVKNLAKTPAGTPKDSAKNENENGWMVGVGLNEFFTVGGQQASSWNSGGITGTLGDYIPVPMVRYYFNPKLYTQLEVQINTPQYIRKNLVAVSTPVDSVSALQTVQTTVSINKLFYFNVPLSVHYNIFDEVDLGIGFQYSQLTNGIGDFNNNYTNNGTDSMTAETKSFKGDSIYKEIKTHEFRILVDANYTWKHFILGIRYNEALSKFIHVEISPGQITQARNSSLQLYLRYILWDGRKRKPLLPSK